MKAFVGRLGQYKILSSEKKLYKHLIETELFSENSLFHFAEKHKTFVIKPLLGPGEISISSNHNQFQIQSYPNQAKQISKESIFSYLNTYLLDKKYYIIQPQKIHSLSLLNSFHYYVTVHRDSETSKWQYISITEINRSIIGRLVNRYFLKNIEQISILAAKKLGDAFPLCRTIVIELMCGLNGGIWIKDTFLHFSRSKWSQFLTLRKHKDLIPSIPETSLLTKVTFHEFLMKYKKVIIKPYDGQQGIGIVQITTQDHIHYEIQSGRKKLKLPSLDEAFNYVNENFLSKKYYIVQQKLSLLKMNDCPLDIRVITQKDGFNWTISGKLAKVAGKGFFITNAAQKLLLLEDAIHQSNSTQINIGLLEAKIESICLFASKQLEKFHSNITLIGFDIGISPLGDVWIIEANFKPDISMFYNFEDKTFYKNIMKARRSKK